MSSLRHALLLLLVPACAPAPAPVDTSIGADPDTAVDSGAPDDSGTPEDDEEPEQVPGSKGEEEPDTRLLEVCQAAITCPSTPTYNVKQDCSIEVLQADGTVEYAGPASVWGRGRSSSRVDKTQYGVELHDEAGEDVGANLLGMGKDSDWIFNGNWYDRSLVRNKTGYDLFQAMGGPERYAPQSGFCELTLNGDYRGVYSLVERIKRDDDRVDIEDVDDGTAFVVKKLDHECFYRLTTAIHCWKLISPNEEGLSEEAADRLTTWFEGWEDAVKDPTATTDEDGVWAWVDLDSAVDIVLLEEFMKNEDAWTHSVHAWKDVDGKMHFSPWDLDMTWGNLWYYDSYGDPETWVVYRPELVTGMSETAPFKARIGERWAELREGPFATEAVLDRVTANQEILGDAIARNFERWPIEEVDYSGYFYKVGSYAEEDAWVRDWLVRRLEWMDAHVGEF